MSQENVEAVRRSFDAFNRRDLAAFLDLVDPNVEWLPAHATMIEGSSYRGHAGIRRWFSDIAETWEDYRVEPHEVHELDDDRVLMLGRIRGRGKDSGASVESDAAILFKLRDGRMLWQRTYHDRSQALETAGLK